MKLKLIALAVAALVSGGANAFIATGANNTGVAANDGNGNVVFTAWDSASSYIVNTGLNFTSFQAAVAAGTYYNYGSTMLTNWLTTANAAEVQWTMFAADSFNPVRALTTSQVGIPVDIATGQDTGSAINLRQNLLYTLNLDEFLNPAVTEAVSLASSASYAGTSAFAFGTLGYALNFNSNGTLANNTADTGLKVIRIQATNVAAATNSTYFQYNNALTPTVAYLGADKAFHVGAAVTAVPEPESLAMLLAGMGVVGTIAARRRRFAA